MVVIEKALSYGNEGALSSDVKAALLTHLQNGPAADHGPAAPGAAPLVRGLIAGIGGREIRTAELVNTLRAVAEGTLEDGTDWIGIKL